MSRDIPESLAICAAKNECRYILEWIAYYKVLGFDQLLIVTNDNTDQSVEVLTKLVSTFDWIHFIEHSASSEDIAPQVQAYSLAKQWMDERRYIGLVGVFDADEFLVINSGQGVKESRSSLLLTLQQMLF